MNKNKQRQQRLISMLIDKLSLLKTAELSVIATNRDIYFLMQDLNRYGESDKLKDKITIEMKKKGLFVQREGKILNILFRKKAYIVISRMSIPESMLCSDPSVF